MDPQTVETLIGLAETGAWSAFIGGALLACLAIFRSLADRHIPDKYDPITNAGVAVVAACATALFNGVVWYQAIVTSLLVTAFAVGFWRQVGDAVFSRKK